MNLHCKLCEKSIVPYEPGTVLAEGDDSVTGIWHEQCFKEYREDYKTADEIIAEVENED